MRFKKPVPKDGEERVVTKFLWLPKTLRLPKTLDQERRWLERASWLQKALHFTDGYGYYYEWNDVCWADD